MTTRELEEIRGTIDSVRGQCKTPEEALDRFELRFLETVCGAWLGTSESLENRVTGLEPDMAQLQARLTAREW